MFAFSHLKFVCPVWPFRFCDLTEKSRCLSRLRAFRSCCDLFVSCLFICLFVFWIVCELSFVVSLSAFPAALCVREDYSRIVAAKSSYVGWYLDLWIVFWFGLFLFFLSDFVVRWLNCWFASLMRISHLRLFISFSSVLYLSLSSYLGFCSLPLYRLNAYVLNLWENPH